MEGSCRRQSSCRAKKARTARLAEKEREETPNGDAMTESLKDQKGPVHTRLSQVAEAEDLDDAIKQAKDTFSIQDWVQHT